MAAKRKAIGKRLRFEVFKRDSFTCQYCGRDAPNVVLNIEHVIPVKEGGTNDIVNLVTACEACNSGKSSKLLSDDSAIKKQKKQMDEINERRAQIEMMAQWRADLAKLDEEKVDLLNDIWKETVGEDFSPEQRELVKRYTKKSDIQILADSIEAATRQYIKWNNDGSVDRGSVENTFTYINIIAAVKRKEKRSPGFSGMLYAKGILRNRLSKRYYDDKKAAQLLTKAHRKGADSEELKELCKVCNTWSDFKYSLERFTAEGKPINESIEELRKYAQ